MAYETILYDKRGAVATITLNRPDALNALSQPMVAELHRALDEAEADRDVRAILLTGAGRGFSAGYDIARRPDGRAPLDGTGVDHAELLRDRTGGLKAFLEARDGAFKLEPFGPRAERPRA